MKNKIHLMGDKSYKESQIVMLPTRHKAIKGGIGYDGVGNYEIYTQVISDVVNSSTGYDFQPQHLYFLGEQIEDMKLVDITHCMFFAWRVREDNYEDKEPCLAGKDIGRIRTRGKYFEIIASTDQSLGLPRPSDDFLKAYCQEGGIDKVLIEYKSNWYMHIGMGKYHDVEPVRMKKRLDKDDWFLKIAPDNTITIKPLIDKETLNKNIMNIKLNQDTVSFKPAIITIELNTAQEARSLTNIINNHSSRSFCDTPYGRHNAADDRNNIDFAETFLGKLSSQLNGIKY